MSNKYAPLILGCALKKSNDFLLSVVLKDRTCNVHCSDTFPPTQLRAHFFSHLCSSRQTTKQHLRVIVPTLILHRHLAKTWCKSTASSTDVPQYDKASSLPSQLTISFSWIWQNSPRERATSSKFNCLTSLLYINHTPTADSNRFPKINLRELLNSE